MVAYRPAQSPCFAHLGESRATYLDVFQISDGKIGPFETRHLLIKRFLTSSCATTLPLSAAFAQPYDTAIQRLTAGTMLACHLYLSQSQT
jgi:hypothetical protein